MKPLYEFPALLEPGHCQSCRHWLTVAGRQYARSGFCQLTAKPTETVRPGGQVERFEVSEPRTHDQTCDRWAT